MTMDERFTPKQIAQALEISSTTLRRYESLDLIPEVPRTQSKHRLYTEVHYQAFITIRTMLKGYDYSVVYKAMRKIKFGTVEEALWLVNHQQYLLQIEKQRVEEIQNLIKNANFDVYKNIKIKEHMSIGIVAEIAGVNTSAIRHWESEGLLKSERNSENGYRMYSKNELKKVLVISSLRKTIYFIEPMKKLLNELELHHIEKIEQSFQLALGNLNHKLLLQFNSIKEMTKYLDLLMGTPLKNPDV